MLRHTSSSLILLTAIACGVGALAGCRMQPDHQRPTLLLEPSELWVKTTFNPLFLTAVFSNSTDRKIALAPGDIHIDGNLLIVPSRKLQTPHTWDDLMTSMPYWAGGGLGGRPVVIEPGQAFRQEVILCWNVAEPPSDWTNRQKSVSAIFCGWGGPGFAWSRRQDFPRALRPYVWTSVVTSMPVTVYMKDVISVRSNVVAILKAFNEAQKLAMEIYESETKRQSESGQDNFPLIR